MLKVTRTTTNKEAVVQKDGYTYNLQIAITDSILNSVVCNIMKKVSSEVPTPDGLANQLIEQDVHIGVMQSANGQFSSQINEGEDMIKHLIQMNEFVKEIKEDIV